MRFALLCGHLDGFDLAGAIVDSGRHQLVACSGPIDERVWRQLGEPPRVSDVEEILADPGVEAVIVAGSASVRAEQLRRAIQSERHVLCAHPADAKPDLAYEASMMRDDTGYVLFPLLPECQHPAIRRLAQFVHDGSRMGDLRLVSVERASVGELLDDGGEEGRALAIPGWDVLRTVGGEISEVSSFSDGEDLETGRPALLAGRFEKGGLFQVTLLPQQAAGFWKLAVVGTLGRVEVAFPQGWDGPAFLEWREGAERREEVFPRWDGWSAVLEEFEKAVEGRAGVTWQDEVRSLELDDASRRSVEKRRVNLMEYQEASEEVGFKGTMTLAGCGLLWAVIVLLIVSVWVPWVGWAILPLLLAFAAMQVLRWLIPKKPDAVTPPAEDPPVRSETLPQPVVSSEQIEKAK